MADLNGDERLDVAASSSSHDRVDVVLNGADVPGGPDGSQCPGDCDGSATVTINELVLGVNIALGGSTIEVCPAFDLDDDPRVGIAELVAAVRDATTACTEPAN